MKFLANLTKTLETKVKCKTKFYKQSWEFFSGQFNLYASPLQCTNVHITCSNVGYFSFQVLPITVRWVNHQERLQHPQKTGSDQIIILRCTGEHLEQLSDSFIMHYYMMVPPITDIFWLWSQPKTGLWHSERGISDDFSDRDHGFETVLQRR